MMHFGIDFGSKLAGTTVICYNKENQLHFIQSEKKKDADHLVLENSLSLQPGLIAIDAPLSLPLAYFGKGDNFFYRSCDQVLRAMSPMFLGGLTARAMRLNKELKKQGIPVIETYPAQIVKQLFDNSTDYQKKQKQTEEFVALLQTRLPYPFAIVPDNWHQVDAALAWWSGYRFLSDNAIPFGNKAEGIIWI